MDSTISAWLDEADDVMLGDFDPDEDDSDVEILDYPESSDVNENKNESDIEMFCFDEIIFEDIIKVKIILSSGILTLLLVMLNLLFILGNFFPRRLFTRNYYL